MFGLFLKDYYLMKRNLKAMGLIIIMFGILGWQDNSSQMMIAIIPIFTLLVISLFNYDQQSHFETFAMTLPVAPKSYVLEKLLFALLLALTGTLLSAFLLILKSFISVISLNFILVGTALGFLFSLIIFSLALPIFFKFPIEIARMYFISFTLIISFLGGFIADKLTFPTLNLTLLLIILALFCLVTLISSYFISLSIFKKKFNG